MNPASCINRNFQLSSREISMKKIMLGAIALAAIGAAPALAADLPARTYIPRHLS
jgi:hypothetical protein